MSIISHYPELKLIEHNEQVSNAARFLISNHALSTVSREETTLLEKIILYHDLGKASSYFQNYISAPTEYKGSSKLKSHSNLSSFLAFMSMSSESWKHRFIALQTISGHHSKLRSIEELKNLWSNDEINRTLGKQLADFNGFGIQELLDLNSIKPIPQIPGDPILDFIMYDLEELIKNQKPSDALLFRLKTQLLFSLLLESDKTFLAVPDINKQLAFKRHEWEVQWVEKLIGKPEKSKVNQLRNQIRQEVIRNSSTKSSICSLTSPTGTGKTFLGATWAFIQKRKIIDQNQRNPSIIIVLPFLSIINQTVIEFQKILKAGNVAFDGSWMLASHSLSDRKYNELLEESEESFFIDTWRSDVIITTYDRFLYSIMDPRANHQLRFHNILDSVIIFDEVQSLPAKLWASLDKILNLICEISNTRVLLMSATLPSFVSNAEPLIPNYKDYFSSCSRYNLIVKDIKTVSSLNSFIDRIILLIPQWIKKGERVLITLNTRRSAQSLFKAISNFTKSQNIEYALFFISSDVIPMDRVRKIDLIKKSKACIVVSTQSIEAGVDIDMTLVYRDFAPLDSLIQIAGRCNRNGLSESVCNVNIVQLKSENGRLFSEMIYDKVKLEKTRQVLSKYNEINERSIIEVTENYFSLLMSREGIDTGNSLINKFSYWEETESIKSILRGDKWDVYDLCLLDRDQGLIELISKIWKIENRWERREAWRRISGRLAQVTISVIANKKLDISRISEEFCGILKLNPNFYDIDIGFSPPLEEDI